MLSVSSHGLNEIFVYTIRKPWLLVKCNTHGFPQVFGIDRKEDVFNVEETQLFEKSIVGRRHHANCGVDDNQATDNVRVIVCHPEGHEATVAMADHDQNR